MREQIEPHEAVRRVLEAYDEHHESYAGDNARSEAVAWTAEELNVPMSMVEKALALREELAPGPEREYRVFASFSGSERFDELGPARKAHNPSGALNRVVGTAPSDVHLIVEQEPADPGAFDLQRGHAHAYLFVGGELLPAEEAHRRLTNG